MESPSPFSVLILAAGKGTRMLSSRAKVLHEVFFQPMLHHVLRAVAPLQPTRTVVIVGHQEDSVREALIGYDVTLVRQEQQLGTGHAVQMAASVLPEEDGLVMILCGDSPLIQSDSLQKMKETHIGEQTALSVMTTVLDNPKGYGRILSKQNSVIAIIEEKEADESQRRIQEINAGIYLVRRNLLFQALQHLSPENTQGEYYLTDIISYAVANGYAVQKYINACPQEVLGINSQEDLEAAHRLLQRRRNVEMMRQGVRLYDRDSVSVSPFAAVGRDTLLMPNVLVSGNSSIGESCTIEQGVIIKDCTIGFNVRIGAYSVLQGKNINPGTEIPPLTCLI